MTCDALLAQSYAGLYRRAESCMSLDRPSSVVII
jgi:hypothetical protein